MSKKDSKLVVPTIVLIILILITILFSLYVYYYRTYKSNTDEIINKEVTTYEKKQLEDYLNNIAPCFSKILVVSDEKDGDKINYNNNLLTDENKQRFVFDYLNLKNIQDISYYSSGDKTYMDLNIYKGYYKLLFGSEFTNIIHSDENNTYDNEDYVYYNDISLDKDYSISNFKIKNAAYDGYKKVYSALSEVELNESMQTLSEETTAIVIIEYNTIEEDIQLLKFKIRK